MDLGGERRDFPSYPRGNSGRSSGCWVDTGSGLCRAERVHSSVGGYGGINQEVRANGFCEAGAGSATAGRDFERFFFFRRNAHSPPVSSGESANSPMMYTSRWSGRKRLAGRSNGSGPKCDGQSATTTNPNERLPRRMRRPAGPASAAFPRSILPKKDGQMLRPIPDPC